MLDFCKPIRLSAHFGKQVDVDWGPLNLSSEETLNPKGKDSQNRVDIKTRKEKRIVSCRKDQILGGKAEGFRERHHCQITQAQFGQYSPIPALGKREGLVSSSLF